MYKKLLLGLGLLLAVACSSNPVAGKWTNDGPLGQTVLTFNGDKTFQATAGNSTTPVMAGTYAVDGKDVKMTMTKFGEMDVPKEQQQPQSVSLSDDGKTLSVEGVSFTKQ